MNKQLTYASAIAFLAPYIKRYGRNFIMFYLGWLFMSLLTVVKPILFGIMIDEIVYYQNTSIFNNIALLYLVFTIFSCLLYFFIYFQQSYIKSAYSFSIRKALFDHYHKTDSQELTNTSAGDLMTPLQRYGDECTHFVVRNIVHMSNNILIMIIFVVYLLVIDWRIGLFALLAAPISVFINTRFGSKIRQYGNDERRSYGGYASWILEVLTALKDVRMLGASGVVSSKLEHMHEDMFAANVKTGLSSLTAEKIVAFTNLAIQLCIFAIAGYAAASGLITVGVLTIVISFYASLTDTIGEVSYGYLDAQNRVSYVQWIYDFLQKPTEEVWHGTKQIAIRQGKVDFQDVSFAYNESTPLIRGLSFTVAPGERLGLVGKSGCGKTTLAYMMIGFYRPQRGHIVIDGQALDECSLQSIRQSIGVVQQDVLVFDGTLRENILLGNTHVSMEALQTAFRQAGLGDFIDSLPNGIDTLIGSKGIGLSGGQKQRVAIARIYLKRPQILIFDEATSALDEVTENSIHDAWQQVLKQRTSIIISHRLSSAMLCDTMAIVEDGHIVESGNPRDLAAHSIRFRTLFAIKEGAGHA